MSDTPRRTWIHDLEDRDYHIDINIGLMCRDERQQYYGLLYQAAGELSSFMPNPYPYLPQNDDPTDFPQDCPGEWHAYNAAYHAILTAMDALAGLVDIVESERND